MKKFKGFIGKIIFIFCTTLMFGILGNSNVFAADQYTDNIIPKMSGYTNGNVTVSADAYYTGLDKLPNQPWMAFDGVVGSDGKMWYCNGNALPSEGYHWIKVDFGSQKDVCKITTDCTDVNASVKNFKLQGSNDNNTWTDIYTGINTFYNGTKSKFTFDNKNSYRYYRVLVLDSYSSYGKTYCGISELEMMEKLSTSTNISLNKSTDNLQVGQTDTLIPTITPDNATNKAVTWTSSDPTIATVDSTGKVTAVKEGTATITATTADGSNLSASCAVTVNSATVTATGITLNKSTDALTTGNTDQLSAILTPSNVTTTNVTWTSSDPTIATVDATGKITAIKEGIATIMATTGDGSSLNASCTVNITTEAPVSQGTILNIEPENNKIHLNETVSANLTIDNIKDIAAEDVRIKYDNTKLQFVSMDEVDGIKLVKSDTQPGELRVIVASKGAANVVEAKKALLKLNFKGIAAGDALVDVTNGRVSDGITTEKDLQDSECGQATITIEDSVLKDVNNSGEFTLLDLAIDGRHYGEDPKSLTQYNTDIVENNAIDNDDLTKIGEYMLANPNYKF
jgi:transglutaminase/protease-like cytokinesis protein 3